MTDAEPAANDTLAQSDSDLWVRLREATDARIGLGRAGDALPTARVLEFSAAHAAARDAVHQPLDASGLSGRLSELGLGEPGIVASAAATRAEYLRRPDLGRVPSAEVSLTRCDADIGLVLADGLSAHALEQHGVGLVVALKDILQPRYSIAPPVIATQARVAIGDHIGAALGVRTVVVIIGERPGLSVPDSLGIYLTHAPEPGRADSQRNCISNIHPPGGLEYRHAARIASSLLDGIWALGRSGVDVKDISGAVTR